MARRGHNEGSIRQRESDGRWEATISLGNGKRKSFYAKTRAEAARKMNKALRDRELGIQPGDERQTLAQYLTHWLQVIAPTLDEGSWQRHEDNVRLHIVPTLGRARLARLSAQQVQALYAELLESGLSSSTVHRVHATLHKALEAAVKLDLVPRNVSKLVTKPRDRHSEMHPLSQDDARRLLQHAAGGRWEALYTLAIATGMREGELLALRWRDVDLEARPPATPVVHVRASLAKSKKLGGKWVFKTPKTPRSRRQIALAPATVEVLRAHRRRQREQRLLVGAAWADLDLVFTTGAGGPLAASNVYREFQKALATAGVPRVRFHDLRHTCATLLLIARVNPKVVSEMLGHASVSTTLNIYSHVIPDMQQDAAATMARLLYG